MKSSAENTRWLKKLVSLFLFLFLCMTVRGQVTISLNFSGSSNSFKAEPNDAAFPGSEISKASIGSYSVELRAGYYLANRIEIGGGISFDHYSKLYNEALKNFEADNILGMLYSSYRVDIKDFIVYPGFVVAFGDYKPSVDSFSNGRLTKFSPELGVAYPITEKLLINLLIRHTKKRISRNDLSTGSVVKQIYKQHHLLGGFGLKYLLK